MSPCVESPIAVRQQASSLGMPGVVHRSQRRIMERSTTDYRRRRRSNARRRRPRRRRAVARRLASRTGHVSDLSHLRSSGRFGFEHCSERAYSPGDDEREPTLYPHVSARPPTPDRASGCRFSASSHPCRPVISDAGTRHWSRQGARARCRTQMCANHLLAVRPMSNHR